MPADADIAAAARRVAELWRRGEHPLADDRSALLPVLDAVGAEPRETAGWRAISDTPPADTEGDVWADHGDGLSSRIADCLFDGVRWIRQEVPFCDWTPVSNPLAWMPKPGAPMLDAGARAPEGRFKL